MNQKEKNRVMVHKTTAEMVRRDEANIKSWFLRPPTKSSPC